MAVNYWVCPKCVSKNSVKIIYGIPSYELFQEAEAGKVKLGGCCIFEDSPDYSCKDCGNEWSRLQAKDAAYKGIKAIKASVGGYFGGYYSATIDLISLKTIWSFSKGRQDETSEKQINKELADEFIRQLDQVDLLNWKAKYLEPGICDGTHWGVEISSAKRSIKKHGDNRFPPGWEAFCQLIKQTTGNEFK